MKKPTILIADDDRSTRTAYRARLHALGFRVIEASDGLGVLERCLPGNVDAMILDYDMPNGDGQTVARMVRRECDAPIVFASGFGVDHFRSIVMELPDTYYLHKPVDPSRLLGLLEGLLSLSA